MIFVGLAGMASFKDMAPLKNPFKYMDGIPEYSCYGARLGCKFNFIKIQPHFRE